MSKQVNVGSTYNAKIFPLQNQQITIDERTVTGADTAGKFVGVCFSGGGSRSLSATLGQMRGLRNLGLLEKTLFISSVSGGSWASSLFTYLPQSITDDDFLGQVVLNPGDLWWIPFDTKADPNNLDYLTPNNMGHVPTRLGFLNDFKVLWELKETYKYPMDELWVRFIGKTVFEPYGLSAVYEDKSDPSYGKPTKFYSLNQAYLKKAILENNPSLGVNDFYLVERNRPFLVVNTSMFKGDKPGSELLPVESTAVGAGIRQAFPNAGPGGRDIGGGLVQPFAFGSVDVQKESGDEVKATVNQRFSLSDISGLSSAAFAEMIQSQHPEFDGIIPRYNYWPVKGVGEPKNASMPYLFADGGNLENTGIMAQLARRVPTIIVFVNCETEIKDKSGVIVVDSQLPPLFGFAPMGDGNQYKKYKDGGIPEKDMVYSGNQVFPYPAFSDLLNNLWSAKQSGGPVIYYQKGLQVLPNSKFNVPGNMPVDVVWVYNSLPEKWWEKLNWKLRAELDADVVQFGDFPHYATITQLKLSPVQVNLLAHMQSWNIIQDEYKIGNTGMTSKQLFESLFN